MSQTFEWNVVEPIFHETDALVLDESQLSKTT